MEKRFETFTSLILQINRSIQRIKSMEMTEFQLKGIHAMCLFYLSQNPARLTQAELAKLCSEDKASISRALSELGERGLVIDTQLDQTKKYNARILLTDEGSAIAEKVNQKITRALDAVGTGLDEAEREALYLYLEKINEDLQNYIDYGRTQE